MNNKLDENDEVFIGARALKGQIDLILPTYNLLIEQIEQIRKVAGNKEKSEAHVRENNNTIGIFGARGTGKTSALYTIMEKLQQHKEFNIILPIIEPDNFGDNTKIMGSIIGLLSDVVDRELKSIAEQEDKIDKFKEYFNSCIYKENNPLKSKRDELIEYHLYTESEYRTLLTNNFDDTATHIKKSSYLLTPDIKFKEKLTDLINLLVRTRKILNKSENIPVLVFIFIDDIDLKTTKCKELIDSILQYASHPNVVTLLSGDYDILKESLTLALINDENLKLSNLHPRSKICGDISITDRKKYLANEYLKKIIPPARRHNVVNWNITTIPNFTFGNKTLANQLYELMGDKNFFGYKDENGDVIPITYAYSIFDKTPRGIINVYYHIYQIIKSKTNDRLEKEKLFQNVKSLIDTIILSSRELVDEQKSFLENYLLWGNNSESTVINYGKIEKFSSITDTDKTVKWYIHRNLFNYFIVCEILRELVVGVSYNESDYNKLRSLVLKILYLDPKDKFRTKSFDSKEANLREFNLTSIHNIVLPIAINTNLKLALLLLEFLTSSKFKDNYFYDKFNYDERYEKDRNAFIAIYKLINHHGNKDLLKNMYLKSYDDKNSGLDKTFNFLNDICSTSKEHMINERIFNLLITNTFYKTVNSAEIINLLLLNTLIKIQNLSAEDIEKNLSNLDKDNKFYKQYTIIKKFNDPVKFSNITDRQKNKINKIIEGLGKHIFNILSDNQKQLFVRIKDDVVFNNAKDKFLKGFSGNSDSTIYAGVKNKVKYIEFSSNTFHYEWIPTDYNPELSGFGSVFRSVKNLSNNYRVWYGRQEAINFLFVLKQQFYLNFDILKDIIPLIYELSVYLKNYNPSIVEDIEFEKYKSDMKDKLYVAFGAAMEEVQDDLTEMGSTLEEDEDIAGKEL